MLGNIPGSFKCILFVKIFKYLPKRTIARKKIQNLKNITTILDPKMGKIVFALVKGKIQFFAFLFNCSFNPNHPGPCVCKYDTNLV